jgi:uncharacterized membrane protein
MMNQPMQRSKLAIASFVISIGTFVAACLLVVIFFMFSGKKASDLSNSIGGFAFYTFLFGAPAMHLAGLILGIVALFQKRGGKAFAVLGIVLNLFFPALGGSLIYLMLSALGGYH